MQSCFETAFLALHTVTGALPLTSYDCFEVGGLQLFRLDGIIESGAVVTYEESKTAQNLSFVFKIQADPEVTNQLTRRLCNSLLLQSLLGKWTKKDQIKSKR